MQWLLQLNKKTELGQNSVTKQTHKDRHNLTAIDAAVSNALKYVDIVLQFQSLQNAAQRAHKTTASRTVPTTHS